MNQTDVFHYPPDLFELMIGTIPLLNRSKDSVLSFFKGAGVSDNLYQDIAKRLIIDRTAVNKFEICRIILTRLNEKKDAHIRERRELLKRVVEFESFSNCWEGDVYKAKGLVSEIRSIVNVKDSFTRMKQEKEKEQAKHSDAYKQKVHEIQRRNQQIEKAKQEFYALFAEQNPHKRGKALEAVLNNLFSLYGILINEAFIRNGEVGEGIIEQVDGVVEIDGQIYFVEMKWKKDKVAAEDIFSHLGRIYHRSNAYGIFISESGFTDSALRAAKDSLTGRGVLVLADLSEFVYVLENGKDLLEHFKSKIRKAIIDKQPFFKP